MAAASAIANGSRPGAATVTLSVPAPTAVTLTTGDPAAAAELQAALDDPARIAAVSDVGVRRSLAAELRQLTGFLADKPKLAPYRAHLWYVAHHSRLRLSPRKLAALLWCTVWFPSDCR